MAVIIQLRRGTALEWTEHNPILAPGEMGVELDTGRFKVGNGTTPWNDLDAASGKDGAIWLVDTRAPVQSDGKDGDMFLQSDTGDVFWKQEGSWVSVMNLVGPEREAAVTWHTGNGSPGAGLGQNRDFYWDLEHKLIYSKDDGSWAEIGDLNMPDSLSGVQVSDAIFQGYQETVITLADASGEVGLDASQANVFNVVPNGTITDLDIINAGEAGKAVSVTLFLEETNDTPHTVNWNGSILWRDGEEPELAGGSTTLFTFVTVDGGTSWLGMSAGAFPLPF